MKSNVRSSTIHSWQFSDKVHKSLSMALFPEFVDLIDGRIPGNIFQVQIMLLSLHLLNKQMCHQPHSTHFADAMTFKLGEPSSKSVWMMSILSPVVFSK